MGLFGKEHLIGHREDGELTFAGRPGLDLEDRGTTFAFEAGFPRVLRRGEILDDERVRLRGPTGSRRFRYEGACTNEQIVLGAVSPWVLRHRRANASFWNGLAQPR